MEEASLGPIDELAIDEPTLRKAGETRLVCIRRADRIDVLDDRCPHEGYPLSQGEVRGDTLTCCWHNWKFDAASGECLFGGEGVRRYPARVVDGQLRVDLQVDPEREAARLEESLDRGLAENNMGSVMRAGLRFAELTGSMDAPFAHLAADAARRARYGFDHGLAMLADVRRWVDDGLVDPAEAFAAASTWVAEPLAFLAPRTAPAPRPGGAADVLHALRTEAREDAEAIARHLARTGDAESLLREAIVPFLAEDLAGYGHGAIFALKARELASRSPDVAEVVWGAQIQSLSWATLESALPGWRVTHRAIRDLAPTPVDASAEPPATFVQDLLRSEKSAVEACVRELGRGVTPSRILRACAEAAALRVARFDDDWERALEAPVTVLDVSHTLTFAEATLALAPLASPLDRGRLALQAAAFIGKLHEADRAEAAPPLKDGAPDDGALQRAVDRRDLAGALRHAGADGFYEVCAPFALHHAFVRPIFAAHAVKTTEAARRLEALHPAGAARFRSAVLTVMVPRRAERFFPRTATVATRFLADGRPPRGLY